jgi:hypothetical protein
MPAQILCWKCLGIAEKAILNNNQTVALLTCPDCGMIWEEEHHQQLWNKYQIDKSKPSRNHFGKIFQD